MLPPLIHPAVHRLARRIHAGEVVFFVGAGFSIDSEGLSAKRLVRRLILRLHALEAVLDPDGRLTSVFAGVFGEDFDWNRSLGVPAKLTDYQDFTIGRMASRYYEVNEWMIQAFASLLPRSMPPADRDLSAAISQKEREFAELGGKDWIGERFRPLPAHLWEDAVSADPRRRLKLGKLLFVDTMGFLDDSLMAGCVTPVREASSAPDATWSDLVPVGRSYRDNFRARHHVLARLAREGLCTTLVTTNFDLLLEGAFRLAGFCWPEQSCDLAPTSTPHFDVIDSAASFYTRGKAFRTATILKLHGCARRVRTLAADPATCRNELDSYLDEVVFTYREIQNWRDDSWAADYVRTLLRTSTVVFSGYSTADPVIHDTVRSVYEEMSREQAKAPTISRGPRRPASLAPAYFFAYNSDDQAEARHEFHGREILRAASLAVGAGQPSSTREHPNYLRFRRPGVQEPRLGVDELLRWVHHLVFRRQQQAAMHTDLRPLAKSLLGRVSAEDINAIQAAFRRRLRDELRSAHARRTTSGGADNRARRNAIRSALDWTSGFHRALLREWACGQALQRTASLTRDLQHMMHPLWYFPASERPAWTAWTAVLELALERLAELAQQAWNQPKEPAPVTRPTPAPPRNVPALVPTQASHPTVMIRRRDELFAPQLALTLRMRGLASASDVPDVPGHPARNAIWTLGFDFLPWIRERFEQTQPALKIANAHWTSPPPANVIWQLAAGTYTGSPSKLLAYLGSWAPYENS